MLRRAAFALVLAPVAISTVACHTTRRVEVTRRGHTAATPRPGPPRALPPTLVITDAGQLRFVEPLRCTADVVDELETTEVVRVTPNLATVVVGLTAASLGGVGLFLGLDSDDPAESPLTYGGAALLAIGLPLMIGPWFGNRTDYRDGGAHRVARGGREEPCGERAVAAQSAVLTLAELRIRGDVDDDGALSISPFAFVDAFDTTTRAVDVTAELAAPSGAIRIRTVLEPAALGRGRDAYLRGLGVDAAIEPMRKVPRLEIGPIRVARVGGARPALRVALSIGNAGPGDAYAVRGRIATRDAEIDGRLLYFGRIAAHTTLTREIVVPLTGDAEAALARQPIDLQIALRDAHGTAPDVPAHYRGPVPREGSR